MWPANSRPRYLNTDNPTVNQGRAAIGNQRRRRPNKGNGSNGQWLDRQAESLELTLQPGGALEEEGLDSE
jgi:hypothetical protein